MLLRLLVLPAFLICDLPMMIDFQGLIIDRDNVMSKFCDSPEALFLEFSFCLVCFFCELESVRRFEGISDGFVRFLFGL
jgi:hypothetical protein